ncbi:MAG: VWA domain-containing protein [Lachnospiraceae bacterium]|nr:VWA domain-containing protein [Lachnospiraceae bacterium]
MRVKEKKSEKKWNRLKIWLAAAATFFMMLPLPVYAEEAKILSAIVFDGDIYIYIRGITQLQQDSVVQIGNQVCQKEQMAFAELSDSGISRRSLILIDNSKSIPNGKHEDIQDILHQLVSLSAENEQFKIGVFSDQITYLCDYTNDKETLNGAIEELTYSDQNTYLSDVLYHVISELKQENIGAYTRLIVFADGADDNAIGYANDEVRSYIAANGYPVYSVGIPAKNNESKLEIMFSFSRASASEYFLLDGSVSNDEIVSGLMADQEGICLKITPEEGLKDGSNKSILLKLNTSAGSVELTANVDMPFGTEIEELPNEEKIEEEEEKKSAELPVLKPGEESTGDVEEDTAQKLPVWLIILLIIVLLTAVTATVIFAQRKKKKPEVTIAKDNPSPVNMENMEQSYDETIFNDPKSYNDDAKGLWKKATTGNYLVLRNLDNPSLVMQAPIVDKIRIGRREPADLLIEGDGKVSKLHCEIILRGELLYIKDCNSTNGTLYEGVRIYSETPIVSGGKIEIGAHQYRVELVSQ